MIARMTTGVMLATALCRAEGEAEPMRTVMVNLRDMVEHTSGTVDRTAPPDLQAELREQAPELCEEGSMSAAAAAPRWHAWQETLGTLDAAGRSNAFRAAHKSYASLRRAFQDAQLSNNVHAMSVLVFEAEYVFRRIASMDEGKGVAGAPPPVTSPRDLRSAYDKAMQVVRADWLVTLRPDQAQVAVITQMVAARSLAPCAALFECIRTNTDSTVTPMWLARVCKDLTLQDPMNIAFWYGLATSRRLSGDQRGENTAWHQTLKLFPDARYAHYRLACTCGSSAKEATRAIVHLRWLLSHVQEGTWLIRIYNERARRFIQRGDYAQALVNTAEAAKRSSRKFTAVTRPLYTETRKIESTVLLHQDKPNEAVRALEEAVTAAPDDTELVLTIANTLFGLAAGGQTVDVQRADSALLWYDKALRAQPLCAAARARKAYLHLLLNRWDRAQEEAVLQLAADPRSVCALTVLGLCYLAEGDADNALVFFGKALDIDPRCPAALDGRALARAARH